MLQFSIHPRVYSTAEDNKKSNTCKSKDKNVTMRKVANMEKHVERHPKDARTVAHIGLLMATL